MSFAKFRTADRTMEINSFFPWFIRDGLVSFLKPWAWTEQRIKHWAWKIYPINLPFICWHLKLANNNCVAFKLVKTGPQLMKKPDNIFENYFRFECNQMLCTFYMHNAVTSPKICFTFDFRRVTKNSYGQSLSHWLCLLNFVPPFYPWQSCSVSWQA
jgi:hypothetical protein